MKTVKATRRQLFQAAAAVAATAATARIQMNAHAAEGDALRIRMPGDIQVLDPGYMIGGTETTVQFATLPRLARPVFDGEWGWVASDYVSQLEQVDELNIAFTLKPGFQWSDGFGELTAEDVKFSFERMPESDWGGRWSALDRVDVTDTYSGVIVLKEPSVPLWLIAISSESGSILSKAATEAVGGRFTTELPAQCGPYRMTEWVQKQYLVFESNPDWQGEPPAFGEVRMISIEDDKTAELAFESGDVDMTGLTADSLARLRDSPPPGSVIVTRDGPYETWIGMNTEHPKLQDIRVRKAIQRAIDTEAILQAAYAGAAPPSHGIVPLGVLGNRSSSNYSYDPQAARNLLAEAGVSDLSLQLTTLNQKERLATAQIVQSNLVDVGIGLEIDPVDSGTFWSLGLESEGDDWKTLEMWIMTYVGSPDPADHMQWFVKDQIGIWNWERWSDPEFEELWAQGLVEQDPKTRADIYVRMQEIMEDTGAYVWLTHDPLAYLHRDSFVPELDPAGIALVYGFTPS